MGALALAVVVFGFMRGQEHERLTLLFERQAVTLAQTLRTRLDDSLDVLSALESFYASAPAVSRQAFHTFVQRSVSPTSRPAGAVVGPPCAGRAAGGI